jgi:hypothetical protein
MAQFIGLHNRAARTSRTVQYGLSIGACFVVCWEPLVSGRDCVYGEGTGSNRLIGGQRCYRQISALHGQELAVHGEHLSGEKGRYCLGKMLAWIRSWSINQNQRGGDPRPNSAVDCHQHTTRRSPALPCTSSTVM